MKSETAIRLKNAGFSGYGTNPDWVFVPTVPELIEQILLLVPDKFLDIKSRDWTTHQWVCTTSLCMAGADFLDEALAELWIQLKERKQNAT